MTADTDSDTDSNIGEWVTIPDAARLLGVTVRTIRRQVSQGKLPHKMESGRAYVRVSVSGDSDIGGDTVTVRDDSRLADLQAEIERLQAEAEAWKATADRLSGEGAELWDKWAAAQAEAERYKAVADEIRSERDFLRSALATAMQNEQRLIEASSQQQPGTGDPESKEDSPIGGKGRPWWKFWKG